MSHSVPRSDLGTHEVYNQPDVRGDFDLWQSDPVIRLTAPTTANLNNQLGHYARTLGQAKLPPEMLIATRPSLICLIAAGEGLMRCGITLPITNSWKSLLLQDIQPSLGKVRPVGTRPMPRWSILPVK